MNTKVVIDSRRVFDLIVEINKVLMGMKANNAEVMLATQELTGRVIAEMSNTHVGSHTLTEQAKEHLDRTVRIGLEARGVSSAIH